MIFYENLANYIPIINQICDDQLYIDYGLKAYVPASYIENANINEDLLEFARISPDTTFPDVNMMF